ncbi:hypothetical protein ACIPRI_10920 [Variovorax sp. LARHSF232]
MKERSLGTVAWGLHLVALTLCLLIAGCGERKVKAACTEVPTVDGYRTVVAEGGTMRLRLPSRFAIRYTQDCAEVRSFSATYFWDGSDRLLDHLASPPYDTFVQVYPTFQPLGVQPRNDELRWPEAGASLKAHGKYPLDLIRAATSPNELDIWAVRGTLDPTTGHPFVTVCAFERDGSSSSDPLLPAEFGKSNPDARCRGAVRAVRGDKVIFAGVHIWARNAPYIDKIYSAVQTELGSYILAD